MALKNGIVDVIANRVVDYAEAIRRRPAEVARHVVVGLGVAFLVVGDDLRIIPAEISFRLSCNAHHSRS
jgi:hypothetical protein